MMSFFCLLSAPTIVSRLVSSSRAWSWRPLSILFISTLIVLSWPMPPPLSSIESAPSTSSTSGLRLVRESGMKAPLASSVDDAVPAGGSIRAMYFSPSRLVCRTSISTLAGTLTSLRTRKVTRACQPTRSTSVTRPTTVSLAITSVRGTTLRASEKSAVTW